MHNSAFSRDGADYAYVAMDVQPDRLPEAVEGLKALGFVGFNVTLPHKEAMIPLVNEVDEAVRLSGAVNTVIVENGRFVASTPTEAASSKPVERPASPSPDEGC